MSIALEHKVKEQASQIKQLEEQIQSLTERLEKLEERKKPGPKPRNG